MIKYFLSLKVIFMNVNVVGKLLVMWLLLHTNVSDDSGYHCQVARNLLRSHSGSL